MACRGRYSSEVRGARCAAWLLSRPAISGAAAAILAALVPGVARASMFAGETLDKVADVLAIVVLIIVPIVAITVFWLVHILPEKIAEKRHHPQAKAIQTLCLLSLVFGGLLWPIAWLWAYTRPVLYKMAYGTDTVDPHAEEGHAAAAPAEGPAAAEEKGTD